MVFNKVRMQSGWVIVYVPGGDIYQMLDTVGPCGKPMHRRVLQRGFKTLLALVQLYWWVRT